MTFKKKLGLRFFRFSLSSLGALSLSLLMAGCLPEEIPSIENRASVNYQGFEGITSAQTISGTRVKVTWEPSTDTRVVAYNIYDATFKFQPKLIRTIAAPASEVTLNGLASQYLYSFRVRAADAENNEDDNTNDLQAIPYKGALGVQIVDSTTVKIDFTPADEVDEIGVWCRRGEGSFERFATVKNVNNTDATLSDLAPGESYTCRAAVTIDNYTDNNEEYVSFTPMGKAAEMIFAEQPGNTAAGENLSRQPVVHIIDENGNIVAGGPDSNAMVTLTISNDSPTTGVINGTFTTQAVNGVAAFSDLSINEAGIKILSAQKSDTSSEEFGTSIMQVDSSSFLISPGQPSPSMSMITISPQSPPAAALIANGSDQYTVFIKLADEFGNAISGVRPAFTSNIPGDGIIPPASNTDEEGETMGFISATVADNPPMTIRELSISAPGGLSTVTRQAPFVHGTANRLLFTTQPLTSPAGAGNINDLSVAIQDAQGNVVTTGAAATAAVSLSIYSNVGGATLLGTTTVNAADGVANFPGLGIDNTGIGYRLVASSGSLNTNLSSSFNITAGVPQQISVTGPASTRSGDCSTAVTVQLQDNGGNPSNAPQNTFVNATNFGEAEFYTSSSCSGSPITTLTFTAGTHTRTLYMRNNAAEAIDLTFTDASAVMTPGLLETHFSPRKMALLAQAAPPAAPLSPLSVVAGQCSTEITITPMGANDIPGPTFAPTSIVMTGLLGTDAQIYSDPACNTSVNPANVLLPINSGPDYGYRLYVRGDSVEDLNLTVSDPNSQIDTISSPQTVHITPAGIGFSGPDSVVAGTCSQVFTVELLDANGNPAQATADIDLNINGISGGSLGQFYNSAGCTGAGSNSALVFPNGATALPIYFKSVSAEVYNISLSDPLGAMTDSPTLTITVSPSAFRLTAPMEGISDTNICAGPFTIETLDGIGEPTAAVDPITALLSGAGLAGYFYSDSSCDTEITETIVPSGVSAVDFYFRGYYPTAAPESSLTFVVTDADTVLTSDSVGWDVNAVRGWLGTSAAKVDENGDDYWFRADAKPASPRYDGLQSVFAMAFDPSGENLYVVDYQYHRVLKYDYVNGEYLGWIGRLNIWGGQGITGSKLSNPSPALCASTLNGEALPGWCLGGQSRWGDRRADDGMLNNPSGVTVDDNYLYVTDLSSSSVIRYEADTGAFDGYIGGISNNNGTQPATGGPATCSTAGTSVVTPGWCKFGAAWYYWNHWYGAGDGRMTQPRGITHDADYLYVLTRHMINRYDKTTGAFAGWVGRVHTTPTSGEAGCSTAAAGTITPGWCFGGWARALETPVGAVQWATEILIYNGLLIVSHANGRMVSYDKTSGAVIEQLPNITLNRHGMRQGVTDGTHLYYADRRRVIKLDNTGLLQSWIGKIGGNSNMSGPLGCSTAEINTNTPGWCLNGTARRGFDNGSFQDAYAVALDNEGRLLVGQYDNSARISRFDKDTGEYIDTLSLEAVSPKRWTDDAEAAAARFAFDDNSMFQPATMAADDDHLYLAEYNASRVKKINKRTGEVLGWVGNITTRPTGGIHPNCTSANPFAASPGWCKGMDFLPASDYGTDNINEQSSGVMLRPVGVATDNNWVYVSDYSLHRITRYNKETGEPGGWIGRIYNISPSGGAPGCNGAPLNTFTPGWCTGGTSRSGVGDGELSAPGELVVFNGVIYVVDGGNHRISSYNAATGAFNGWIGAINASYPPTGGCTVANKGNSYDVADGGWCFGGRAQAGSGNRGGGFHFWGTPQPGGVTAHGNYLYVANFYNRRIDRIRLVDDANGVAGQFVEGTRARTDIYTASWTSDPNTLASWAGGQSYPMSLWTDGVHIYGTAHAPYGQEFTSFVAYKMDLTTGNMVGWQGGVRPNYTPAGGDVGCNGATQATPGWCQGGYTTTGSKMGQFDGDRGYITGDDHYVYVSDLTGSRVTRFRK